MNIHLLLHLLSASIITIIISMSHMLMLSGAEMLTTKRIFTRLKPDVIFGSENTPLINRSSFILLLFLFCCSSYNCARWWDEGNQAWKRRETFVLINSGEMRQHLFFLFVAPFILSLLLSKHTHYGNPPQMSLLYQVVHPVESSSWWAWCGLMQ